MKKATNLFVTINFVDKDEQPLLLTGTVVRFMIKDSINADDSAALVSLASPADITFTGTIGEATATITTADANELPNNRPLYCEGMCVKNGEVIARTLTQQFILDATVIKAIV
jgi:hypothetical protein